MKSKFYLIVALNFKYQPIYYVKYGEISKKEAIDNFKNEFYPDEYSVLPFDTENKYKLYLENIALDRVVDRENGNIEQTLFNIL